MEQYYKLDRVRELADNDTDFIKTLAMTFVEEVPEDTLLLQTAVVSKDYLAAYKSASARRHFTFTNSCCK